MMMRLLVRSCCARRSGGNETRHLGVAGMLLVDRDHVDEARAAPRHLPDALDPGHACGLEIVPERGSTNERGACGAEISAGIDRARRRRRALDRVIAMIDRLDLQHRLGTR